MLGTPDAPRARRGLFSVSALVLGTIAALTPSALGQRGVVTANTSGGVLRPTQAWFDVKHVELALRVDPETKTLDGTMTMTAHAVAAGEKLELELDDHLAMVQVQVDGVDAEATHEDGVIAIDCGKKIPADGTFTVAVGYEGQPLVAANPPWKGGLTWAKTPSGKPWIATSCQGEGADVWWPCKDHPSDKSETMDLKITVPGDLYVAANGTLQSVETASDDWKTFHWHVANPIANYCVAINIGPYVVIERKYESVTGEQVRAIFYALPESEEQAKKVFPEFLDHVRHMEEICGPYPFRNEKYGVVETPHLGMEHQTIIAYGNKFRKQQFNYDWLHHHEMCHEWWANLVTARDWKDMWIHEGIGTYMQALYVEKTVGPAAYRTQMLMNRGTLKNTLPVAPREIHSSQDIYFSSTGNDVYYKGSWVTHTLRYLLSDEVFFKVLRRWAYPDPKTESVTDGSQVRFSDTEEIRAIAEKHSGQDLEWFFEVYLRQGPLPELVYERDGDTLTLEWKTANDLPFPMPVPVKIGDDIQRVEMPAEGPKMIKVGADRSVKVDPDSWLLRKTK